MKTKIIIVAILISQILLSQKNLTSNTGSPIGDNQNSVTIGLDGPVLLEDIHLLEKLAAFDRERIPERVVHARGTGAIGEFICKKSFKNYTKSKLFNEVDKITPVFVRFSTVIHGQGSPETVRDPRGFATKFYTQEGNYDIVGNNLPIFFIRDAIKFPDMVHSLKPSPVTNVQDPNRFFDFFSHIPESTHMLTRLYSDYGIPANYRQMNGSSVHAFKWINEEGKVTYVKYTWKSKQGEKNLSAQEASIIQSKDFQHATVDLYENIKNGNFPKWDLFIQLLDASQFEKLNYNPLDATKIWNEKDAPLQYVGTMTLNKIPDNFFENSEMVAFSPGSLIPGIEPSEDKLLQGRLFSYFDTQRYRLGGNFQQLKVNKPIVNVENNNQNGLYSSKNSSSAINFQPSTTSDNKIENNKEKHSNSRYGDATVIQSKILKTNDYQQAGEFYRSLDENNKLNLIKNLVEDLGKVEDKKIQAIIVGRFYLADFDYGKRLANALNLSREFIEKERNNF